jgi:4-diphosphocytidyl-2-C-methyl-D-erythritol kinase
VFPRSEDGYHPIKTLFQTVNLSDRIFLSESPDKTVFSVSFDPKIVYKPALGWEISNTLYNAFSLLSSVTDNPTEHWKVHLEKNIPVQSGLGGGSTDAAAVLRFFGEKNHIEQATILKIAKQIGSDVPFLLCGGTVIGEGHGERLFSVPTLSGFPVLLLQPSWHSETASMYRLFDTMKQQEAGDYSHRTTDNYSAEEIYEKLSSQIPAPSCNDFEQVARAGYPDYSEFYKDFTGFPAENPENAYILQRSMTGSGSVHYILFRKNTPTDYCENIKKYFEDKGYWTALTHTRERVEG